MRKVSKSEREVSFAEATDSHHFSTKVIVHSRQQTFRVIVYSPQSCFEINLLRQQTHVHQGHMSFTIVDQGHAFVKTADQGNVSFKIAYLGVITFFSLSLLTFFFF